MTLRIERSPTPTDEERLAILTPLIAYNAAQAGDSEAEKVALLVRDEAGAILGGLYGRVFYRWLFIELLSVPEQGRGLGLGSTLMNMAEELANEKECVGIWLDTFSFQAPAFYKKLGFSEFGQIADYPPGHKRYFFQKRLIQTL
ncbi:GNAT family N-acetyltransferase [Pseudomonas sp. N3-W]|jgi:ribosomal protein S18 acetylase RimI-like enzyme|uniref:GNAT family N-acetyltransferase n=1 Tax=Pseudomonas fungipugnans TaxID=3024217 RepID=A0ABT6QXZ0_9PSED|nr:MULTISPECIES: GNAT family N-acetyltransferase [unclassified Pseudomonas]MDI2595154.1 GNAT family N-acetyltransferase [Pseudomonas sp. 681]UWF51439.1 GNAT family N-acetyltransferase [Pseudomonas sp. N3-W]